MSLRIGMGRCETFSGFFVRTGDFASVGCCGRGDGSWGSQAELGTYRTLDEDA